MFRLLFMFAILFLFFVIFKIGFMLGKIKGITSSKSEKQNFNNEEIEEADYEEL